MGMDVREALALMYKKLRWVSAFYLGIILLFFD